MVYATYQQYVEVYGGTVIKEEQFPSAILKASRYIDCFTFGRITSENVEKYPELVGCSCEIAEAVMNFAGKNGIPKQKKSENIDGYSVSYVTEMVDGTTIDTVLRKKAYEIAKLHLMHTGLLYCGI